ncbi:MAG: exopolyphosphatase [Flavobacteriales bacterium]|jgi:exopolyphosphatase/guanosine-5'-triphosphate,3'-diphosphate pyrophosphatase|nr:exopolyphosphatase [Flavobacteriales bacterium]
MISAIIDLGTNTFNLLVYERVVGAPLRVIHSEERPVFLGRGGIEHGVLTTEAMERGMEALALFKRTAAAHGATALQAFGTSALRNAHNAHLFTERALAELGIRTTVIPGAREAELILAGVRQAVPFTSKPALVMDIGGGSIEFVLATEKALMWKRSFELGTTRLRERIPIRDPITIDEEARIAAHIDDRLEALYAILDRHEPHLLIGSAGSFDSLATMIAADTGQQLDPQATTLAFSALDLDALKDRLLRMDRNQRLAQPGLPEYRVDTLPYALIVIDRVLTAGGIRDLAWSRYALKEGAAVVLDRMPD